MRAGTGLLEECSCGSIRTMGIQESRQPNFPALQGKGLGVPAVHVQGMLQVWQRVKAVFLETAGLLESCCTREGGLCVSSKCILLLLGPRRTMQEGYSCRGHPAEALRCCASQPQTPFHELSGSSFFASKSSLAPLTWPTEEPVSAKTVDATMRRNQGRRTAASLSARSVSEFAILDF